MEASFLNLGEKESGLGEEQTRDYPVRDAIDFQDLKRTKNEGQINKKNRH